MAEDRDFWRRCILDWTSAVTKAPVTTTIKLTSCKEMGGATSHACQSGPGCIQSASS